jgi:hypothetical protein
MRPKLAKPLGKLFDAGEVARSSFAKEVGASPVVVSVGDRVTETLGRMGRVPDVQIVDAKENRVKRRPPDVPYSRSIRVRNPPGTITGDAIEAIRKAFSGKKPCRVLVEGEEDLLVIPAVILAPTSATVLYGQPGVGIVAVRVTAAAKARNRALLARMAAV